MSKDILIITRRGEEVINVENEYGDLTCFDKQDLDELKSLIHKTVDGEKVDLWVHRNYEERNTIMYLVVREGSTIEVTTIDQLVYHLHHVKTQEILKISIDN